MRIFLYILLAVQFVTQQKGVMLLEDAAFMWTHFGEHKAENPDMGWLDFVSLHYSDSEHAATDSQHQKLPFQHAHILQFSILSPLPQEPLAAFEPFWGSPASEKLPLFDEAGYNLMLAHGIFQPPKA